MLFPKKKITQNTTVRKVFHGSKPIIYIVYIILDQHRELIFFHTNTIHYCFIDHL